MIVRLFSIVIFFISLQSLRAMESREAESGLTEGNSNGAVRLYSAPVDFDWENFYQRVPGSLDDERGRMCAQQLLRGSGGEEAEEITVLQAKNDSEYIKALYKAYHREYESPTRLYIPIKDGNAQDQSNIHFKNDQREQVKAALVVVSDEYIKRPLERQLSQFNWKDLSELREARIKSDLESIHVHFSNIQHNLIFLLKADPIMNFIRVAENSEFKHYCNYEYKFMGQYRELVSPLNDENELPEATSLHMPSVLFFKNKWVSKYTYEPIKKLLYSYLIADLVKLRNSGANIYNNHEVLFDLKEKSLLLDKEAVKACQDLKNQYIDSLKKSIH